MAKLNRSQYFEKQDKDLIFLEELLKYGGKFQEDKSSTDSSLFGGGDGNNEVQIQKPQAKFIEEWDNLDKLNKEKEVVGIFLSSHPLDDFRLELETFCNTKLSDLQDIKQLKAKEIKIGGIVTNVEERTTKTGNPFGNITFEDYNSSYRFTFFSKDYLNFKSFFEKGYFLYLTGKVQNKYKSDELELKVLSIKMLADLRENDLKSIALKLAVSFLTEEFITEIINLAKKNKGKSELSFLIFDEKTKIWIQLVSKKYKIQINNHVLDFLKEKNITYAFNK